MRRGVFFLGVALVLLSPAVSRAEMYVGAYAGVAFPESSDIQAGVMGTTIVARDVGLDTSAIVGGKLGYWLDPFPYVGFEIQAFHHNPDARAQTVSFTADGESAGTDRIGRIDLSVTTVGVSVLARWPGYRVQPYAGGGPALFMTRVQDTGRGGVSIVSPAGRKDTDTTVGVQAIAGLNVSMGPHVAFFVEYKFSRHHVDVRFADEFLGKTKVATDLSANFISVGLTYHFSPW